MKHLEASSLAFYLNSIYSGPPALGCAAFCDKRSGEVDSDGFWVYYISSPYGVFLNGRKLSFKEESKAISDAMEVLGIHD